MPDIVDRLLESAGGETPNESPDIVDRLMYAAGQRKGDFDPLTYQRVEAMSEARARHREDDTGEFLANRAIPFGSVANRFLLNEHYKSAADRWKNNEPMLPGDADAIARVEAESRHEREGGLGRAIVGGLASVPAMLGEATVGGEIVRGAGLARAAAGGEVAGGAALAEASPASALAIPSLSGAAKSIGRLGLQTATMPSMYLEGAQQRAAEDGGEWYQLKNLAPAYATGAIQTAVLGSLQKGGGGIPGFFKRIGVGMGEQQLADLGGYAAGLQTRYGLLNDLADGKKGDLLKNATVQAVTFAAFAAMHGGDAPKVLDDFKNTVDESFSKGAPTSSDKIKEATDQFSKETASQLQALWEHLQENNADLKTRLQQELGVKPPEAPEQPGATPNVAPATPNVAPEAAPELAAPRPAEPEIVEPARPGAFSDSGKPQSEPETAPREADSATEPEPPAAKPEPPETFGLAAAKTIAEKVQSLGSLSAANEFYSGDEPSAVYGRRIANWMYGETEAAKADASQPAEPAAASPVPGPEAQAAETADVPGRVRALYDRAADPSIPMPELEAHFALLGGLKKSELVDVAKRLDLAGMAGKRNDFIASAIRQKILDRRSGTQAPDMSSAAKPNLMAMPGQQVAPGGSTAPPAAAPPEKPPSAARNYTILDGLRKWLAPATRGEDAQETADSLRANQGEFARKTTIAKDALRDGVRFLQRHIVEAPSEGERTERFLEFTDAIERGEIDTLPEQMRPIAQAIREMNDQRAEILHSRGRLRSFVENYLGHIWLRDGATPEQIGQQIASRRPLAGSESFRKQRSLPTYRDGIEMGLTPADWNPVKLAMLKLREMDKAIMGHDVFNELKEESLLKFVRLGTKPPEGWTSFNDKMARVFAPPEVSVREYYDEKQMEGLHDFARSLGVNVDTVAGGNPGEHRPGDIRRRHGTPEEVLAHEIGHELDLRYDMQGQVAADPALRGEADRLAAARYEGKEPDQKYIDYAHSPPEQMANLVAAYLHSPELLHSEAPGLEQWFNDFLGQHPELDALRKVKPSLVLGSRDMALRTAGPMLTGNYYGPEAAMDVLNNHLSPGLSGRNRAFDVIRDFSNAVNMAQLGLSAFHLTGTVLNSMFSSGALGLMRISRGQVRQGLVDVVKSPIAPALDFFLGGKVLREYRAPGSEGAEMAAIVDRFVQGGGRDHMDDFHSKLEPFRDSLERIASGKLGALPEALKLAVPAVLELISKPVMGVWVPRAKAAAAANLIMFHMEAGKDSRRALADAQDSIDNRFGQVVKDNLFMNRVVKDIAQVLVRSYSWNLGTIREIGGGIKDIPKSVRGIASGEGITPRTAYVIALSMGTALAGSLLQYLYTGESPRELRDVFAPRTGKIRPDGTEDRVMLPTYMKDIAALTNRSDEGPLRVLRNAGEMAQHKLNPAIGTAAEMLRNEDYYGKAVYDPRDSSMQQVQDLAGHLARSFEPFSARSFQQDRETGKPVGESLAGFMGITPAPAYMTRDSDQQRARESARRDTTTPLERLRKERYGAYTPLLDKLGALGAAGNDAYDALSKHALGKGSMPTDANPAAQAVISEWLARQLHEARSTQPARMPAESTDVYHARVEKWRAAQTQAKSIVDKAELSPLQRTMLLNRLERSSELRRHGITEDAVQKQVWAKPLPRPTGP